MIAAPPPLHRRTTTSNPHLTPLQVEEIINSPHIGYVANECMEVYVIGTSHFRCNSAQEVSNLIEQVQPDGVVIELDPERVLRLTKQYSGFDENGGVTKQQTSEDLLYGADFVAAVNACIKYDIPIFLGDEYAQETKNRLMQQFLNLDAYSPAPLIRSFVSSLRGDQNKSRVRVNLLQSFIKDPQKLTPLVVTSSPPFLLASALAFFDNGAMAYDGSVLSNALETFTSIVVSLLASCLLFNTVIAERDEILAANTLKALQILQSLKNNRSIRFRWEFAVNNNIGGEQSDDKRGLLKIEQHRSQRSTLRKKIDSSNSLPLFTLKTPLIKNAVRNLNLFEPRWLKMIDELIQDKDPLDDKIFGCVRCTNKFYSATSVKGGEEGRYADVIFEKEASYAKIIDMKEGKRPTSGDRRIGVRIKGGDSFTVDESSLSVRDGYIVAHNVKPTASNNDADSALDVDSALSSESDGERVRMVVVVGLLHGNGVVDLLSHPV